MVSANKLIGLLAEPDRRRVVAALILASGGLDEVVSATGLGAREVVDALDRLQAGGLVEQGTDGTFVVLEQAFKAAARSLATDGDSTEGAEADSDSDEERILQRSFSDGRLVHLPRKRTKRLVVLDRLAQEFEPGRHYSEREVNATLRRFDDDVASLRRYLVDERFLDRGDGEYWRSGGTVEA